MPLADEPRMRVVDGAVLEVTVTSPSGALTQVLATRRSDAEGWLKIPLSEPDPWTVSEMDFKVDADGYRWDSLAIDMVRRERDDAVVLALDPLRTVEVVVIDEDGRPRPGVAVCEEGMGVPSTRVATDERGRARVPVGVKREEGRLFFRVRSVDSLNTDRWLSGSFEADWKEPIELVLPRVVAFRVEVERNGEPISGVEFVPNDDRYE